MSGLDNGPENGDFVRYIDALLASRAAASQRTAAASEPPRSLPPAAASPFVAATAPTQGRMTASSAPPAQRTLEGKAPALTPEQIGAIAASVLRGQPVPQLPSQVSLIALLIGTALLVASFLGAAFNVFFVLAGAALVYWALRQLMRGGGSFGPSGSPNQQRPARKP